MTLWGDEIEKLSFPIIIKPDQSTGSRGATVIDSDNIRYIRWIVQRCSILSRNEEVIIEECVPMTGLVVIEGDVFVHNGEILWDGLFSTVRSKHAPMIPMTYVFPLQENKERISVVKGAVTKAIRASGVIHGEYNIEIYLKVTGEPFIIEINPRQGGNGIPKYIQAHTGIDYYRLLVTTSVGDDDYWKSLEAFERENRFIVHHLIFSRRTGRFRGIKIEDSIKECVFNTQIYKEIGEEVHDAVDASSSIGCVDFQFASEEKMNKVSLNIEKMIKVEVDDS